MIAALSLCFASPEDGLSRGSNVKISTNQTECYEIKRLIVNLLGDFLGVGKIYDQTLAFCQNALYNDEI